MKRKQKKQNKQLKKLIIMIVAVIISAVVYLFPETRQYIERVLEASSLSSRISEYESNSNSVQTINGGSSSSTKTTTSASNQSFDLSSIPEYSDSPYVILNNNKPEFEESEYTTKSFEKYSSLDSLGRCGVAYANICKEIMPKDGESRGSISSIKPSGWKTAKYEGLVDGDYLYNRCHLIGWQLAGENANKLNLITGTRYMNVEGMLPFEDEVDDYFESSKNANNHVLYRVTPIFEGDNLVASGVQMEAYSVEDNGKGVCFNVYVYNVQPGIEIDYATGNSKLNK